ncbi:multidrug efflux MFS outer membrane domain protein [Enterobacter hormaechei subsp. xiangfangensis]|nr:multidrug efflux MFS outer membrane domain protein [Enterobacter hormaechei subsp. xiangfangensis]
MQATRQQLGLEGELKSHGVYDQLNNVDPELRGALGPLTQPINLYQGSFDAQWEIDLWGKVRRQVEAAEAQQRAAIGPMLVSLEAEVARAWLQLRGAQSIIATLNRKLKRWYCAGPPPPPSPAARSGGESPCRHGADWRRGRLPPSAATSTALARRFPYRFSRAAAGSSVKGEVRRRVNIFYSDDSGGANPAFLLGAKLIFWPDKFKHYLTNIRLMTGTIIPFLLT